MKAFKTILSVILLFWSVNSVAQNNQDLLKKIDNNQSILIEDVSIFNGKDSTLQVHMSVIIENGIITLIVNKDQDIPSKTYFIIDGKGKTLMPGLIDTHVHLQGDGAVPWHKTKADENNNLAAYLYAGVTTIYDLGGISSKLEKTKQNISKKKTLGPNIYHAHIPITVKNGHPIPISQQMLPFPLKSLANVVMPTVKSPKHAKKIVKSYTKQKIDYVKVIYDEIPVGSPIMSFETLKSICDESHKLGYKVFVHIGSPQNAVDAINAGADILAHGVWRGKLTTEQADIIANSGVPMIYTLAGFTNVDAINNGHFSPSDFDQLLIPNDVIEPVTDSNGLDVHNQKVLNDFFNDVSSGQPHWLSNFKLMMERHVPIMVGTDSSLPGTYAGSTYYQELRELSKYGLSNFLILKGATYSAARLFIDNPNFGSVEINQRADLLLINGNPLEDLSVIESPEYIIIRGEIVKRK